MQIQPLGRIAVISAAITCAGAAMSAEDFRVRYNLVGTLGGDIFAPLPEDGWIGAISHTHVDGKKLTGDDGNDRRIRIPLPRPIGSTVTLKSDGKADITALTLVKVLQGSTANERFALSATLPYSRVETSLTTDPSPAALVASLPAGQRPLAAGLLSELSKRNGAISGVGDLELGAYWLRNEGAWKFRFGSSFTLPTGSYDANAGQNIGVGNFYTLRPEIQATYQPSSQWAFSGKLAAGFNSTNKDNQWRSGNWLGLEAAAAYMTPIGPLGLHAVHINQYQDDKNGNALFASGANRFELTGAGVFFATRIAFLDANLALQQMVTISSRNARHSNFTQIRLVKRF